MRLKNSWNKDDERNRGLKAEKREIAFKKAIDKMPTERPKKKKVEGEDKK